MGGEVLQKGKRKRREDGKDREHWKLTIPLLLQVMVYHGVATVLYFTAFIANAATVTPFVGWYYNNLAAAAVSHHAHTLQ